MISLNGTVSSVDGKGCHFGECSLDPPPPRCMPTPDHLSHTTELLARLQRGEDGASNDLFTYLYAQLRTLAQHQLEGSCEDPVTRPTALVHEIWVRLGRNDGMRVESRRHFLNIAARAMRQVLVDHSRRASAGKRGVNGKFQPLDEALVAWEQDATIDPVALDDLLAQLQSRDERLAQVVELRFFAGLTIAETGEVLQMTRRQVDHAWKLARAWLMRALEGCD